MDAIALLKDDHKRVNELFKKFEAASERAYKTKRKLVDQMIQELTVHAHIEEQLFYPAARQADEDMVLEAEEEHHIVKWTLDELTKMEPQDERFKAKVTVLIENVRHHVKEEEKEMLPKIRKAMRRAELKELGERMAQAKQTAPTRPQPEAEAATQLRG